MPGYEVKHEQVGIAGEADLRIRSLLDRQQFADPLGAAEALGISSAQWPLFGLLWPSGQRLADHMARRVPVTGERILEIGCGLALASLVCHRAGADVTASDCHPLAEAFLRENLRLNALPPLPYRHGQWGAAGAPGTPTAVGAGPGGDRDDSAPQGHFDLIIGSDVLYERDDGGTLCGYIAALALPAAQVLIIDPERGNRAAFSRRMDALGFSLRQTRLDSPALGALAAYRGRLLDFRRGAAA